MSTMVRKTKLYGWENCLAMKSGQILLIVTADIGPRIVFLGKEDRFNLLKLFDEHAGRCGDDEWLIYGGHRLWAAPENDFSYIPDNEPIEVETDETEGVLVLIREPDESGLEKRITIHNLQEDQSTVGFLGSFLIRNELVNRAEAPVRTASWGISSFSPGGVGFMPLNRQVSLEKQYQAALSLNLWQYASLADPAYMWKHEWLEVDQTRQKSKQKIGTWNPKPWLAYRLNGLLVVIRTLVEQEDPHQYPDLGCNIEVYFDEHMLELETLSPWKTLEKGESVYHDEIWTVIEVPEELENDRVVLEVICPLVK